jgi:phosphate starvation-inducible PhoH-like protein
LVGAYREATGNRPLSGSPPGATGAGADMGRIFVRKIGIEHIDPLHLLGQADANLRQIEHAVPVRITLRDSTISVAGDETPVEDATRAIKELVGLVERGRLVEETDVARALSAAESNGHVPAGNGHATGGPAGPADGLPEPMADGMTYVFERKTLHARTPNQVRYLKALEMYDVVFAIGPAGTGKTYLAVAAAVHALRQKKVERIVLVRPAVEAGESLGFLPGDMQEKVDPYLRPLYDALQDLMPFEKIRRFIELGVIEIAPLAFMRGRTLTNAFVILDEAQNTTVRQMKMFLTRLGQGAHAAITGDITQIDLANPQTSGLVQIQDILAAVTDIKFIYFEKADVVRHRLVREILKAFDEYHQGPGKADDGSAAP